MVEWADMTKYNVQVSFMHSYSVHGITCTYMYMCGAV